METGTLKELNVQPGDVVTAVEKGSTFFSAEKTYKIGDGPTIVDDTGDRVPIDYPPHTFRIISRATPQTDLTAITTPFGLLDAATQEALRAHGGPYEVFTPRGFETAMECAWSKTCTYRVKPAPKAETVSEDLWMTKTGRLIGYDYCHATPVRVTFNRIDGVIDLSSYRVEARNA
jgi:hypothetical protein